jgi:hypothetical protein
MFLHGDNMADVHNGTRTVYHTLSTLPASLLETACIKGIMKGGRNYGMLLHVNRIQTIQPIS